MSSVSGAVVLLVVAACTPEFSGSSGAGGGGGAAAGGAAGRAGSAGQSAGKGGGAPLGGGGGGGAPGEAGGGADATEAGSAGEAGTGGGVEPEPDPTLVPQRGLVLWLRADRGVTEEGGVVSHWLDNAYGIDATQTATNQRPKLVQGALAGQPAVVFDGQNDYLKLPALDADFSAGVSIIYSGHQSEKYCQSIFEASNGSEVDDVHLGSWQGYPLYEVIGSVFHPMEYPVVPGEPEVLMGIHQGNGTVRLRRNTFGLGEASFATPTVVSRSEVFVGHSLYTDCGYFAGAIGELLVYGRALTDAEVVSLETYLQQKYDCCTE